MSLRPNYRVLEEVTKVPWLWPACNFDEGGGQQTLDVGPRAEVAPGFWPKTANSAYYVLALPLSERALIARIRRASGRVPPSASGESGRRRALVPAGRFRREIVTGIGDDCAVLRIPKDHEMLVTTDFSLEGVHFRREWHPPESVGHRCLARGLSDIAAMGGIPVAAFLSLALPAGLPQRWVDRFLSGLLGLARQFNVELAGGDTAQSPAGILADIVVAGCVPTGKAILRSGARPGDRIYVSGALGGSAAALDLLVSKRRKRLRPDLYPEHFFPTPQIKLGQILRKRGIASAMIDISDGFSTDLSHMCEESGVGAEVHENSIPRARTGKAVRTVHLDFALHGGEDYQLLFTAHQCQRVPLVLAGVRITEVGVITKSKNMVLIRGNQLHSRLKPLGWEHFRRLDEVPQRLKPQSLTRQ